MNPPSSYPNKRQLKRICVYCASSTQADPEYRDAARETGRLLAREGCEIIYGGGGLGSMGALADGALEEGGRVIGVLPEFMQELEWGHSKVSELKIVASLHERKLEMIEKADGIIALPGGSGTFEELLEALTWKRLALYTNPIALLNTRSYYDAFQRMMEQAADERFMNQQHLQMWTLVDRPQELIPALKDAPEWDPEKAGLVVQ
ncbi:MAG: TIGR00730 family Rossman fold protein [SAR324 cluster bacterium]|nr:TIGR00730 family Rossman fold protein [SAR324 cluster bacterium]